MIAPHSRPFTSSSRSYAARFKPLLSPRIWLSTVAFVAQFFFLLHIVTIHFCELNQSEGPSMLPTLFFEGDWLLSIRLPALNLLRSALGTRTEEEHDSHTAGYKIQSSKYSRLFGLPLALGDIVVAISPYDPLRHVCKRIVGLPGDRILIDPRSSQPTTGLVEDSAADAGVDLDKSPTVAAVEDGQAYITVPNGHVFLAGDNLSNSTDSRHYGPVPLGLIKGKVVARVWPLGKRFDRSVVEMLPMAGERANERSE